jgi:regulatory protein
MADRGAASQARALELAYRYLNRRERTVHELRQHLAGRDLEPAAVDAAIGELTEAGYLDDRRYARIFAQDKRALEQWGSSRIRQALIGRGIDRELIEAALAEPGQADDERERALAVLERRFADPPRDRGEQQRALGVLLRRGYDPELAIDAVAAFARGET